MATLVTVHKYRTLLSISPRRVWKSKFKHLLRSWMQYQPSTRTPGSWLWATASVRGWHYRYLHPYQQSCATLIYLHKALKRRPEAIHAVFLLFPTLSNIASTPNGRLLAVGFILRSSKVVAEETKASFLSSRQTSSLFSIWLSQIST